MGLELRSKGQPIGDEAQSDEGQRLKEEGKELAFHAGEKVRIGSEEVKRKV